ncbi:DUF7344 domain-containing protein [Halomarina pelagica]|uniref:DUF7344 domain-containing protein n=1 Tax=Halomarina pelagica TaxID=2961599 RepID=UPI0020C3EE35|nr:hypothetical protein [Halomarina sp. BND7]
MNPGESDRREAITGGTAEIPSRVPRDELLDVLADANRRRVLARLSAASDEVVTLDALCERLYEHAAREPETDPERDRRRLAIRLHHTILPRLDEAGLLEYDPRRGRIRYADRPTVESLLDEIEALTDELTDEPEK